jgi:hypothetical protein
MRESGEQAAAQSPRDRGGAVGDLELGVDVCRCVLTVGTLKKSATAMSGSGI